MRIVSKVPEYPYLLLPSILLKDFVNKFSNGLSHQLAKGIQSDNRLLWLQQLRLVEQSLRLGDYLLQF
jgi:hypothetical protein